jgi:hypothetical protein
MKRWGALWRGRGRTWRRGPNWEEAVKLEPKNASFHYELGRLYQKTGDGEGAKRELELSKQMYGEKASPTGQELPEGVPPAL